MKMDQRERRRSNSNASSNASSRSRLSSIAIFWIGLIAFLISSLLCNHLALQRISNNDTLDERGSSWIDLRDSVLRAYAYQGDTTMNTNTNTNINTRTDAFINDIELVDFSNLKLPEREATEATEAETAEAIVAMTKLQQKIRMSIPDEDRPSIVWLMSYPNSGTSFTMVMTHTDSNTTVAVNYPQEPQSLGHPLESLYTSSQVPFILQPNMTLPSKYIMTKTHCDGYCTHCHPNDFVDIGIQSFLKTCRSSRTNEFAEYKHSVSVKKAIHLMRDPVDNVVSNYRLLLKGFQNRNSTRLVKHFTNNKEGFLKFCDVSC